MFVYPTGFTGDKFLNKTASNTHGRMYLGLGFVNFNRNGFALAGAHYGNG
jgi:hypothetical protein